MNLTQPHYPSLPASCPGHRLGTLSFRTADSSFVFMLHEGAWQGSIVYTGYATSRGEAGPVTLLGFTATIPSFSVFRKLRPELLPTKMDLAFEIPDFADPNGPPTQVSITSVHAISPYVSEDEKSFDSLTMTLSLDNGTSIGTAIADGEITGFSRGVAASTVVICAAVVVGIVGAAVWFLRSEDHRHEEAMEAMKIAVELAKEGMNVDLKIDGEHGASGGGGGGSGEGSASMSASISLTITQPTNPTPPAGGP